MPLNGLAAAQIVDLLGDAPPRPDRLLVTGAAGAVGGYVAALAQDRGWRVTGLARAEDEEFVRSLGVDFTTRRRAAAGTPWPTAQCCRSRASPWSATAAPSSASSRAPQPASRARRSPSSRRGARPTARGWPSCWPRTASGELPARVHAVVPLDQVADAHRAVAKGGIRGRYVLTP